MESGAPTRREEGRLHTCSSQETPLTTLRIAGILQLDKGNNPLIRHCELGKLRLADCAFCEMEIVSSPPGQSKSAAV